MQDNEHEELLPTEQAVLDEAARADEAAAAAAVAGSQNAGGADTQALNSLAEQSAAGISSVDEKLARMADAVDKLASESRARDEESGRAAAEQAAREAAEAAAAAAKAPDWDAERASLRERHESGEIDDDEYEAQREALFERKAVWTAEQRASQIVADARAQDDERRIEAAWQSDYSTFAAVPENASFLADPTRLAVFQSVLNDVAAKNPTASNATWLETARDQVAKAFNIQFASRQEQDRAVADATRARSAAASRAPIDLNGLPVAGRDDGGGGRFSDLDRLGIDDLEDRLALMSPADQEAFLADAPGGLRDYPRGAD